MHRYFLNLLNRSQRLFITLEDTAIMLALGADIWVVLVGRVILTFLIIAALARLTLRWQTKPTVGPETGF